MYKSFIRFASLLIFLTSGCVTALGATHLMIHLHSGESSRVEVADGLKVAFDGPELTVTGRDDSAVYSLDDVARITYLKSGDSSIGDISVATGVPTFMFTPESVEVKAEGRHQVEVVDISGRVILSLSMTDSLIIPVDQLPGGVVIITVDSRKAIKIATR